LTALRPSDRPVIAIVGEIGDLIAISEPGVRPQATRAIKIGDKLLGFLTTPTSWVIE
jgi:hypothetical protein